MLTRIAVLILMLISGKTSFSQDSSLIYLQFPTIPPFTITKVPDSIKFAKADLRKRKPVLIIVFNPDCGHCQHETKELIANIDLFKKVQIVMASAMDYHYIKKFYEDYNIAGYPNITMGKDEIYFLGGFYKIRSFPAIFLYDKKGKFVKAFDGSVPVKKIAEAL